MAYQRITRAQLRTALQVRWHGAPFWGDADANQAINDALLYWNALTGYWRRRITIAIPSGDPYGSLPSTLVQGTAITINHRPLTPGSLQGLSLTRPNWRRETTASGGDIPTEPTIWAPASLMQFVVWPAPAADATAIVDGVRSTPRLTVDDEYLDLPDSLQSALLGYALHLAAFKAPAGVLERTLPLYQEFIQAAVDENQALRASDWYKRIQRTLRQHKQEPVKKPAPDESGGPAQQ